VDPYIIRGNLTAYRQTNNPITVYVRDDDGPLDMSAVTTLQAAITLGPACSYWDYPNGPAPELLIDANSPAAGKVQFTLTAQQLQTRLFGPSFNLFVRADDQTVYTAQLEVVG
jgi:hypothetical protein